LSPRGRSTKVSARAQGGKSWPTWIRNASLQR
jgi:hypothetical protein